MIGAVVGAGIYGVEYLATHQSHWPDAIAYRAMTEGERLHAPYWGRWLLPQVLGSNYRMWALANALGCAALGALAAWHSNDWRAAWLLALLSGISFVPARCPMLTDTPAMAIAFASALLWQAGHQPWALALVLVAGACKETAPVFAAAYAGSPWLIVGLLAVRWWGARSTPTHDPWAGGSLLARFRHVRRERAVDWRLDETLRAFGPVLVLACCFGGRDRETACTLATVALAFASCLVSYDRTRLMMWAGPMLVTLAMRAPDMWISIGCVAHLWSARTV